MTIDEAIEILYEHGHYIQNMSDGQDILIIGFPDFGDKEATGIVSRYVIQCQGDEWMAVIPAFQAQPVLLTRSPYLEIVLDSLMDFLKRSKLPVEDILDIESAKELLKSEAIQVTIIGIGSPRLRVCQTTERGKTREFQVLRYMDTWLAIEIRASDFSQVIEFHPSLRVVATKILRRIQTPEL